MPIVLFGVGSPQKNPPRNFLDGVGQTIRRFGVGGVPPLFSPLLPCCIRAKNFAIWPQDFYLTKVINLCASFHTPEPIQLLDNLIKYQETLSFHNQSPVLIFTHMFFCSEKYVFLLFILNPTGSVTLTL